MKKFFSLLLMVAIVAMPSVLTSCGDDPMETIETPNPEPELEEDAKKLIGTWVGYDGTPGFDWTDKYTITFYSSGKATEVCSYIGGAESTSGTYKYSNGKITEWEMEDGSALANTLGDPSNSPWAVTFNTSTEITIGDKYYSITFTKQ